MKEYESIRESLCEELRQYAETPVTRANLETINLIADTIKTLYKIERMRHDGTMVEKSKTDRILEDIEKIIAGGR